MTDTELRDAVANASYRYTEALADYEDALASRDAAKRGLAEERLRQATQQLSATQSALAAARTTPAVAPTFTDLLQDPNQQFDPNAEVLRSVLTYCTAAPATARRPAP